MQERVPPHILDWPIRAAALMYVVGAYTVWTIPQISRINFGMAVLLALLLALRMVLSDRLSAPKIAVLPVGFLAVATLSMTWALDPAVAGLEVIQVFSAFLGALGVWGAVHQGMSWRSVAWACVLGALINVVSASGQVAAAGLGGRAAGLARNANAFAVLLCFAAFFAWCTVPKPARSKSARMWQAVMWWGLSALGLGFVVYATLYSGSRKTLAVLALACILALLHALSKLRGARAWALALVSCWVAVAGLVLVDLNRSDIQVLGTAQTFQRLEDSLSGKQPSVRFQMMGEAIAIWRDSVAIGHGAGQFAVKGSFGVYSHNNFTEILANYGVVGFVLFYSLHAIVLVAAFRGALRRSTPHISALALILTILLLDMGMVTYFSKISMLLLAFAADLAMSPLPSRGRAAVRLPRGGAMARSLAALRAANVRHPRLAER